MTGGVLSGGIMSGELCPGGFVPFPIYTTTGISRGSVIGPSLL